MHAHENFRVFVTRAAEGRVAVRSGQAICGVCSRVRVLPMAKEDIAEVLESRFGRIPGVVRDAVLRASERLQGEGLVPQGRACSLREVMRWCARIDDRALGHSFVGERTVLKGVPEAERWLCVAEGFDVLIAGDRKQEGRESGWQCLAAAFELPTHGGAKKEGEGELIYSNGGQTHLMRMLATLMGSSI